MNCWLALLKHCQVIRSPVLCLRSLRTQRRHMQGESQNTRKFDFIIKCDKHQWCYYLFIKKKKKKRSYSCVHSAGPFHYTVSAWEMKTNSFFFFFLLLLSQLTASQLSEVIFIFFSFIRILCFVNICPLQKGPFLWLALAT